MLSIDEIYYDQLYVVKETGAFIRVNQIDRDAETVADRVGNWYDIEDLGVPHMNPTSDQASPHCIRGHEMMDEESKVKRMTGTIKHLLAEINKLCTELAAVRELADRLKQGAIELAATLNETVENCRHDFKIELARRKKAEAEIGQLKDELQKAHDGWQAEVAVIRSIADDNLERAEKAEAEVARLGRELNLAKYGEPDFSWSIHKEAMSELLARAETAEAEIAKLRAELAAMTAQADAEALYSDGMRAELQAERELSDRLASDAKNLIRWFIANLGESKGELDDIQESLSAHTTWRNK